MSRFVHLERFTAEVLGLLNRIFPVSNCCCVLQSTHVILTLLYIRCNMYFVATVDWDKTDGYTVE